MQPTALSVRSVVASMALVAVNGTFTVTVTLETLAGGANASVVLSSPGGLSCAGGLAATSDASGVAVFAGCSLAAAGVQTISANASCDGCGLAPSSGAGSVDVSGSTILGGLCPSNTISVQAGGSIAGGTVSASTTFVLLNSSATYTLNTTLSVGAGRTVCVVAAAGVTGATLQLRAGTTTFFALADATSRLLLQGFRVRCCACAGWSCAL
jgi:hypothetical protein